MTVSSSTNRVSYSGNGTLTVFAYTFKVFDEADLTVILRASDGTETVQTITTHYTVSGVGDAGGGNVTFVTAPTATETVVILREQPLTQGLDLVPNDPFPAQSLEEALDKVVFMTQKHEEELGRAIKASRTNTLTGSEFTISAADRANKVFSFDGSGDLAVTQELGVWQGNWATATTFSVRDIVKDASNNNVYICITAHTSSGSTPISSNADSAKWALLVDAASATTAQTAAEAAQTAAETAQTAAETAQTAAETAETNAETAETNAETAQAAAEAAQAAAEAVYDNFDDRYLGAKATDPTLDNDGDALIDGALYFDTTNNVMKVYDLGGTAWKQTTPTTAQQTNIDAAVADATDIGLVAGSITNVNNVGDDITNVNTVAGQISPTNNISTVAGISTEIATVAGDSAAIGSLSAVTTEIGLLGVADVITDMGILGTADVVADMALLATTDVVADMALLGTSANVTAMSNVSDSIANVNTVAANITGVNSFAERYRVEATNPTTDLDAGDLAYVTGDTVLKYYNGTSWQSISPGIGAVSDDSNPSLGGDLNLASNDITGTGNVDITGNITASGTVSADNLGEHTITAVASGALANGDVVSLNSDGTITASGDVLISDAVGSSLTVSGRSDSNYIWIEDDKFVFAYSAYQSLATGILSLVVGTVSGTSITLGTPHVLSSQLTSDDPRLVSIGNGNFVVFYETQTNFRRVAHGTVSGTTITMNNTYSVSQAIWYSDAVHDPDQNAVILTGRDGNNSNYITALPVSISGTTLTVGTAAVIDTVTTFDASIVYDSANAKHIIYYRDDTAGDVKAVVGTLSGGTLSYGTITQVFNTTRYSGSATMDASGKPVYAAHLTDTVYAVVGTVSGTSISFGTEFSQAIDNQVRSLNYSSLTEKLVLITENVSTNKIYSREGSVSGTSVSFDSGTDYLVTTYTSGVGLPLISSGGGTFALSPSNKYLFITTDTSPSYQYRPFIYRKSYTENNADNYIGVADAAYSDGATATIQILGSIDDAQTGLTTGSTYFVADDGSLSTTNNGRKIGRAISATEILIDTAMSGPEMNAYLGGLV